MYPKNFKISTRITALVLFLVVLAVALVRITMAELQHSNASLKTVYEDRVVALGQLSDIQRIMLRNRVAIATADSARSDAERDEIIKGVDENIKHANQVWAEYIATQLTTEEAIVAKQFEEARTNYVANGLQVALNMLRDPKHDKAALDQMLIVDINKLYAPVRDQLVKLNDIQLAEAKKEYQDAENRFETLQFYSRTVGWGAIALAIVFSIFLVRNIKQSLATAAEAMNTIAKGDMTCEVDISGKNEITTLMISLSEMQASLRDVVKNVRQGSESVSTASAEIASGNHDLSSRTESQASALEETAASMEQLSATVRNNADNAKQANQLATSASTIASSGGAVVSDVVRTMKEINDSSKKIAEIISVIDSIAFQTNILALNAAVEAARAGEQGRGFAVVATEVRSLASRSADAAKQIKALITESESKVSAGVQLADNAGSRMTEVVTAIQRVADIVGEISVASREQAEGVAQVGEAVTQMDQVTQQNAALVEEMAAAASSLKQQAEELVGTVSAFKIDDSTQTSGVSFGMIKTPEKKKMKPLSERLLAKVSTPAPKKVTVAKASDNEDWESF